MTEKVVALYPGLPAARLAIAELRSAGFGLEQIQVAAARKEDIEELIEESISVARGAVAGAAVGGGLGTAVSGVSAAVAAAVGSAALGPVFIAVGLMGGAVFGAVAGTILDTAGQLTEAGTVTKALLSGQIAVGVEAGPDRSGIARDALGRTGGIVPEDLHGRITRS